MEEEEAKEKEQQLHASIPVTSGSPVVSLVWMRILPTVGSLQTDASAGSRTSPARRMDTPHNWRRGEERRGEMLTQIAL